LDGNFILVSSLIDVAAQGNMNLFGRHLADYQQAIQAQVTAAQYDQISPAFAMPFHAPDYIGAGGFADGPLPQYQELQDVDMLADVYGAALIQAFRDSVTAFNNALNAFVNAGDDMTEDLLETARAASDGVDAAVGNMRARVAHLHNANPGWAENEYVLWNAFLDELQRYDDHYMLRSNDFWGEVWVHYHPAIEENAAQPIEDNPMQPDDNPHDEEI
jgi:hypothetical protein